MIQPPLRVFIGYDSREQKAYQVCIRSLMARASCELNIRQLALEHLREQGLYTRIHSTRNGQMWDVISDAPMSTEFAISRFMIPHLCGYKGWAVFCDCDFLWRADIADLFALADDDCAVMVVQHHYIPKEGLKMDNKINVRYPRKNWSSLMLWNCGHPSNRSLTVDVINSLPGRELHAFQWLADDEIGALPFEWNWLELQPKAVHFTNGTPDMPGYENAAYADEYRTFLL